MLGETEVSTITSVRKIGLRKDRQDHVLCSFCSNSFPALLRDPRDGVLCCRSVGTQTVKFLHCEAIVGPLPPQDSNKTIHIHRGIRTRGPKIRANFVGIHSQSSNIVVLDY